jgi:hypothetical protein
VNTRFRIDLLHPGWVGETWQHWFTGPRGWRRLAALAVGGFGVLLLVLVAGILPSYWRLSRDLTATPGLRSDLAARDADLALLRSNLQALSAEARRQVRWAELLTALSRQIPPDLRLERVETARVAPPAPPGVVAGPPARVEETLRIDAVTPLRPGGAPLLGAGQFVAGLMRDPSVNKRFQVRSWELRPSTAGTAPGDQYLSLDVVLAERPQ